MKYILTERILLKIIGTKCDIINKNIIKTKKEDCIFDICQFSCKEKCPYNDDMINIIRDSSNMATKFKIVSRTNKRE